MLRQWLAARLTRFQHRLEARMHVTRTLHGIPVEVRNTRPDIDTEEVFTRMDAVLALVARHQPARLAHVRRDLAGIRVERFACRGAYFPAERVCMLELTFMVNPKHTDAERGATLVHEGMHARLHRLGERYGVTPFELAPARHERICRRAELDFGLAVPGAEEVVERALQTLQMADDDVAPAVDWREAARRVAAADEQARER
jgi:hypothetical protein